MVALRDFFSTVSVYKVYISPRGARIFLLVNGFKETLSSGF